MDVSILLFLMVNLSPLLLCWYATAAAAAAAATGGCFV
jgi:hypothetical protein